VRSAGRARHDGSAAPLPGRAAGNREGTLRTLVHGGWRHLLGARYQ
jgi:hypothetical protein